MTIWVVHNGPGQEGNPSNFATPQKIPQLLTLPPHPAKGIHTPTRWSLAWGTLTCPLPPTRNCGSLACHGVAQWEGPYQQKLWTSLLGQPGSRGQDRVLFWPPTSIPSLSGQELTPSPCLIFQGAGARANIPGVPEGVDWSQSNLQRTCSRVGSTSPKDRKWMAPSPAEQ